jgi:hypothetical protein
MGGSKQDRAASFYVSVTLDLSVTPYQIADYNNSLTINTSFNIPLMHTCALYILGKEEPFYKRQDSL